MSESQSLCTLILWIDGHQGVVQFVFRELDLALAALKNIEDAIDARAVAKEFERSNSPVMRIEDSYGRTLIMRVSRIVAAQVTDCAEELNGQADLTILQAHANTKLQKRAQQDPMLSGRPMIVPAHQGGAPGPLPFQR